MAEKKSEKKAKTTSKKTTKKEEVKEEVEVNEKDMDTSIAEESKEEWKEIGRKIWDIVFWIVFAIVALTWVVDFFRVSDRKDPMFCLSKKTHTFEDGTVEQCTGLGYKVYEYNRASLDSGIQFGPFFIKMKQPENLSE